VQDRSSPPGGKDPHRIALDVERLDAYQVALEFQSLVAQLRFPRSLGHLRDQLDRAATSIALNIAEAVGRRGAGERAHFYVIARGSAMECAAIIDIIRSRGMAPPATCDGARTLLVRSVQMLTRLSQR
jgi:four helix bundle protein